MIRKKTLLPWLPSYIQSIHYDTQDHKLAINFVQDPELSTIAMIVTFFDVQDFSEEMDDIDQDEQEATIVLDTLIGLDDYPESQGMTRYVIRTQQREMMFRSDKPALIEQQEAFDTTCG